MRKLSDQGEPDLAPPPGLPLSSRPTSQFEPPAQIEEGKEVVDL